MLTLTMDLVSAAFMRYVVIVEQPYNYV